MTPKSVLKTYWGYDSFRPKQQEIIQNVMQGVDSTALLTTGGGKSLCFQIPAMMLPGVTLVISPLIALMKDQVDALKSKGIPAEAIYSGMTFRTIDRILDNAVFGHLKLLYLSPERLLTDIVIARIKAMNLSLVAIDEAHCISQWGYDFRPSYMEISEIRNWHPETPFLALTATATPKVVDDIARYLELKDFEILSTSFRRPSLQIHMQAVDTKDTALVRLLKGKQESVIVYVYSRKNAKDYSELLRRHGIAADFYHAGLDQKVRAKKQAAWMSNAAPVIVCTTAFGMGIDKPDVRQIIHLHLPSNIEGYYQEIGRAGRDGQPSRATLLYYETDKEVSIQRVERSFPPIALIRKVYESLGGYLDLAVGGGMYESYNFDIHDFAKKMRFDLLEVHHCLKVLQREEYISISEQSWQTGTVWIKGSSRSVGDYIGANEGNGKLLSAILRLYQSVGQQSTAINEGAIARLAEMDISKVVSRLTYMHKEDILEYQPRKEVPQITFIKDRISAKNLIIDHENYQRMKLRKLKAAKSMVQLVEHHRCRQQNILRYFGEENSACGICDRCTNKVNTSSSTMNIDEIKKLKSGDKINLDLLENSGLITYLIDEQIITQKGTSYYRK